MEQAFRQKKTSDREALEAFEDSRLDEQPRRDRGNRRKDGKQLVQTLVDYKERVDLDVLLDWLDQKPELNPRLNRPKKKPLG